MRAKMISLD